MPAVHINTSRADLEEATSLAFSDVKKTKKPDDAAKEELLGENESIPFFIQW